MELQKSSLFFETPKEKWRVFQKPRLVLFSEESEVESWANTQPLYFYPFSWLDFLGKEGIRELYIHDCLPSLAEREINILKNGKVHFENPNIRLIELAKKRGHKVSVICNLEDLSREQVDGLSFSDFIKVRISGNYQGLSVLAGLLNERVLTCIKVYLEGGCDYRNLALQAREMGFDFLHVAKRLISGSANQRVSKEERESISRLQELATNQFRIILPSSLEERFARRFVITPSLGNGFSCSFSKYRLVLKGEDFYPCYTQQILAQPGFKKDDISRHPGGCLDCACIYENDMLSDIKNKMGNYKNPCFALEYRENGK